MSKTHESLERAQKVRDRIQWTLAGGANHLRGICATLEGTGIKVPDRTVEDQLMNLWHKGLVHKNLGADGRNYYTLVPLKDKTNAQQR